MAELIDLIDDALSQATNENEEANAEQPVEENEEKEENQEEEKAPPAKAKPAKKGEAKDDKGPKKPRKRKIPPMEETFKEQPTTLEEWVLGHKMYPALFIYTPEGDLQVPPIFPGDVQRVIPIQKMQPATVDHIKSFYETRKTEAKEQEAIYVQSKRDLNRIILLYKREEASIDEVLRANAQVAIEERKLNDIIKLPRIITRFAKVEKRGLTLNDADKDVLKDAVTVTTYTTFPLQSLWMPAPEPEVVAPQPLPIRQTENNSNSNNTPIPPPKKQLTAQQIAIIRARMAKS
jgi:hypothetical protein